MASSPSSRPRFYSSCNLDIAPEFTKRLDPFLEIHEGKTTTLACHYKGLPLPTVTWYKDSDRIPDNHPYYQGICDHRTGVLTLKISDMTKQDEGAYKCKVENIEGCASTTAYITVIEDKTEKLLSQQGDSSPHAVSSAPHLRTITEQKSLEETEADAQSRQPPSPLQDFIDKVRRGQTWPLYLNNALVHCLEGSVEDVSGSSDDETDSVASQENEDGDWRTIVNNNNNSANNTVHVCFPQGKGQSDTDDCEHRICTTVTPSQTLPDTGDSPAKLHSGPSEPVSLDSSSRVHSGPSEPVSLDIPSRVHSGPSETLSLHYLLTLLSVGMIRVLDHPSLIYLIAIVLSFAAMSAIIHLNPLCVAIVTALITLIFIRIYEK